MPDPLIITEDLSAVLEVEEVRDMLFNAADCYQTTLKENELEAPAL